MADKKGFRRIGKGRVFVKRLINGIHGFKFRFVKNDLVNFERMEDEQGPYFRIYPRGETVFYDHCRTRMFNKLFSIESEVRGNGGEA